MKKVHGGFLGILLGGIILLIGAISNPYYTGWDSLIYVLMMLEAPWIYLYNLLFPISYSDIDDDTLSIGEGILLFVGPFLSIALSYFIGYYATLLYQSLKKK